MTYTLPQYVKHLHRAGPDQLLETAAADLSEVELEALALEVKRYQRTERENAKARRR